MKQQSFGFITQQSNEFGGSLLKGQRKIKRPLSFSKPMHFVFKSENAKNHLTFVSYQRKLIEMINNISHRYGIKIYDQAINFNHIHCVVKPVNRDLYNEWIRHLRIFHAKTVFEDYSMG